MSTKPKKRAHVAHPQIELRAALRREADAGSVYSIKDGVVHVVNFRPSDPRRYTAQAVGSCRHAPLRSDYAALEHDLDVALHRIYVAQDQTTQSSLRASLRRAMQFLGDHEHAERERPSLPPEREQARAKA